MPDFDPQADLTGQTIGDFLVQRKLGQGGMGQVYLARQQSLKRDVALKILMSNLASNATALLRFRAEAEAVAKINHTNIVQVYAVGQDAGVHYMALEYVEGRNLREYLARKGPPDLPIALAIIRQVASALQRAFEHGLVHRDIKPENILVTRKAEVKVADFGLSRFFSGESANVNLTQSGVTLGTPLYMSPEQVRGEATDHRSDIYSFGVTCFHLLAGEPPFKGKTPFEVTLQHVQKEPPSLAALRPDLPPDLCAMVHKMMAKNVGDRYQTARDVLRDLNKIRESLSSMGGSSATVRPATPTYLSGLTGSVVESNGSTLTLALRKGSTPWTRYVVYTVMAIILAGSGFAIAATWPRSNSSKNSTIEPGLPTRPAAENVVSSREIKLKAIIENRETSFEESLNAAIQLGLLYVEERRWEQADTHFRKMEADKLYQGTKPQELMFVTAGKFGRGVSLSHQNRAADSNELFHSAMTSAPRFRPMADQPKKGGNAMLVSLAVQGFFLKHPELGQAVSEAILRNAENGSKDSKLEWLTKPGSLLGGPKG
ncbi:MAG: serine/threonine-protein kinase [Gemmataceae bacterium]